MQVVGVHKEASQRRVACLSVDRKGIAIDFLHTFHEEQNLAQELDAKKVLEKGWSFVAGIEGKDLFIRKMKTPLKKRRAILKTLPFQLKSLIPYSMEEGVVKPLFQRKGEMTELTLFALSKKFLSFYLEKLAKEHLYRNNLKNRESGKEALQNLHAERATIAQGQGASEHADFGEKLTLPGTDSSGYFGIDPEYLSSTPMALFRMGEWLAPTASSLLIVHIGVERTELVLVQEKMIDSHLSLALGTQDFFSACLEDNPYLAGERGIHQIRQLDLNRIKAEEFPRLFALAEQFKQRMDRSLCFFAKRSKELSLPPLLFLGDGDVSFKLESLALSEAEGTLTLLEVEARRGFDLKTIKPYAIPLGLSLDVLKQDEKTIDWLEGEYLSPRRKKKVLRGILRGAFLSALVLTFSFLTSHYLIKHRERGVEKKIEALIEEYKEAIPSLSPLANEKGIHGKIELLNKKTLHLKNRFSSLAPIPKVADLLSYLSHHPNLNREEGAVVAEEIRYTLEDLSSFQKGAGQPKIRVELTLWTKEERLAREFYEALVAGDEFVDNQKEIGWKQSENEYEISFYLKN